jgi:DNA-binding protein H-NS
MAPKFRDPATGDTWSGRGLKPKWLTTALESGKKVEDFAL